MTKVKTVNSATPGAFALSVDVEDYFQVWAFSDVVDKRQWDSFERRVGDATRACLDLFDRHGVKATFFTLGWVAAREKALIRDIVARGHELASHGFDHAKAHAQTPREFFNDVLRAKHALEDASGLAVRGYRAAGFSIGRSTPWAYEALGEAGYAYSSSVHPIAHDHYGDPTASPTPFRPVDGADFVEAPVATVSLCGRRVSCAGGGWFRAMPVALSKTLLRRAARTLNGPVIFYFHPWELDVDQPRIAEASALSKLRHYLNLHRMQSKLSTVLDAFDWRRVDETLRLNEASAAS